MSNRLATVILLALLLVDGGGPRSAAAYNEPTHSRIVKDAFDYIVAKALDSTPYSDGATGVSDFALVRSVLAPGETDSAKAIARIRALASELGAYAIKTDEQPDVVLDLPALGPQPSFRAPGFGPRYFFTMFSHFLNVHRPGSLWEVAGYNYLWVETNQKCVNPSNEDLFGNLFVKHAGAKVVAGSSVAMTTFKGELRKNVAPSAYSQNFENAIRFVEFWPLTNVAQFWHDAFVESVAGSDQTPYNLPYLGHLLHSVADATVPYHATGISGCGHRAYELAIDTIYAPHKLVNHGAVAEYLRKAPHLHKSVRIAELVRGNAYRASDRSVCTCDGVTCDCPEAVKNPEPVGRQLVNLAVASTVVSVRIAFEGWKSRQQGQPGIKRASSDTPAPVARPRTVGYGKFPILSDQSWSAITSDGQPISFDKQTLGSLRVMNYAVSSYANRTWSPTQFEAAYGVAVDDWAKVAVTVPSESVMLIKPLEFREPALGEIGDPARWAAYLDARQRFYASRNLFEAGVISGTIKAKIMMSTTSVEKAGLETSLGDMKKWQDDYIQVLRW